MGTCHDLIAVVEACYDLEPQETPWLQGVSDALFHVVRPEEGLLAYHVDVDAKGVRFRSPVQSGASTMDLVARINSMAALMEATRDRRAGLLRRAKSKLYAHVAAKGFSEPADRLLLSEVPRVGPNWMYTLGAPIEDLFILVNHHVDDNGLTAILGGMKKKRKLQPAERSMYHMLSAHIKAGFRLRRRMKDVPRSVDVPDGGAVLTGSGRLMHAEGEARSDQAAQELSSSAQRIDQARSHKSGRGPEALAVWQGLIQGRWSLVEKFDSDGKRFLLAHRNPERVRDPRGLSDTECRVVGLVVRGYADKLVGYHLGMSEGTVSSHLSRALRKLGFSSRIELVRHLGVRYPQQPL
jgi:DNA-binding CsgD family transcriptional regulator